jgi:DNA-binding GntR family transcriptional regulator
VSTLSGEPLRSRAEIKVVRRDRVTLTQSCAEALEEAIDLGRYRPGSRLPSEAELAEQLAVSRPTLRESLRLLEERGMISRRHGRGTFVRERPIQKELNRNFGITSMIRAAGYEPASRATGLVCTLADEEIADRLCLPLWDPVWQIERTRLADERPVVWSIDSFPQFLLAREELDPVLSGEEQSLYFLLQKLRGIVIHRGEAELVPCRATTALRALLDVKSGTPLLCMRQVDFDQHGRPVVFSIEYHVADWVRFSVERLGPGTTTTDM